MAQFTIGTTSITTTPERDRFASLRRRYQDLGNKHKAAFDTYAATVTTADELFEVLPRHIDAAISETVAMVASDLAANRIFEVSTTAIRGDLDVSVENVADRFNRVQDRYFEIIGKAAELEAQRNDARANRGRLIGGGFGVEGAAQGMALAAVANAAIGLTYGLANLTGKAASALGDNEKKRQLLDDPTTKADIGDFFLRIALQGAELVAVKSNGATGKPTYEAVTVADYQKAEAIIENVAAGRVPDGEVKSVLAQALTLDPFHVAAWTEWLDRFGDQAGSVGVAADALGISEVVEHKIKLLGDRKNALSWNTPEDCEANSAVLEQQAERLGLSFDAERVAIKARAAKLDRERRTFNGVEYPSLADATEARRAHDDVLQRTVAGVVHDTHDGANEARAHIAEKAIAASRASSFFGWLTLAHRRTLSMAGRSCRKEMFMFLLFVVTVLLGCLLAAGAAASQVPVRAPLPTAGKIAVIFGLIFLLASTITMLTLQIRRFHDQDRSGWFVLLNVIPYVGWLIAFAFMLVDGTPGDNRFGPNPKQT